MVQFNNLGLVLGMALKFQTSVVKGLKLKVKVSGANSFVKVTGEKLEEGGRAFLAVPVLNRVKIIRFHKTIQLLH